MSSTRRYWFMRIKQGSEGNDFTRELWEQGLVGILYGTWKIEHVLDGKGRIDPQKLTFEGIKNACPQPVWFQKKHVKSAQMFLSGVAPGDRIVVAYDSRLHLGTVGEGFFPDPKGPRGRGAEYFKCRPVVDRRAFPLAELPSGHRLITGTGRGTTQEIRAFDKHVRLLDRCASPDEVRAAFAQMGASEFLSMVSASEWEALSFEYLRATSGLRSLLALVGGTMEGVDIVGVDQEGRRVLAQCKNDSAPWSLKQVQECLNRVARRKTDRLVFFNRGGFNVDARGAGCELVDGSMIARWLEGDPDYLRALKTL